MPASIDIVLDHHSGTLRGRGAGVSTVDLAPATEALLREASQLHVPVRLVVPERLDDAAIAALEALLALAEAVEMLDTLALPDGPEPHILVAADRVVRQQAADDGWLAVAHPMLALPAVLGDGLVFARVSGERGSLRRPGLVAYWTENDWAFAVLSRKALASALDDGIAIERLALDAGVQDPLLVQLDRGTRLGEILADHEVLWSDGSRVLLALDAATTNDAIPVHGSHGHFVFLAADPGLLAPARIAAPVAVPVGANPRALAPTAPVTATSFAEDVARYAGLAPLDADGPLRSRHSSHPDNARVVNALLAELTQIGYAPFTHEFAFSGQILRNVIADHPGSGGMNASGSGVVLLGCHLDSTAARDPGYESASAPARGADDDASGIAALLAIARHLRVLPEPLLHTVRLCFFNAAEAGFVGSRAYAASLKRAGTAVAAVVCCDMIAFNSDGLRTFELHAGFTDPAVRDLSIPLAEVVARAAAGLTVLAPAQVYTGTGTTPVGGSDPGRFDRAINRSDHASFHAQGYPAVLVSEDAFATPPGDPNPNDHRSADAVIDADYAADITRAVSVAVIELSRG